MNHMKRKGPKSASASRPATTEKVVAFARTYNRVPERMRVITSTFQAPVGSTVEELIDLAHAMGLSRGDRTLAGVFELQTDGGIWNCADGSKLLTRTGSGLSDRARFRSWDVIESEEVA